MGLDRPPRAITIDDVADRAGVSAKTVSRVLNNEPNVRPSKRELVLKASRELGYRPNPAARSLASSKSFLIAHLHDNPVPEYVTALNTGIYNACRANGFFLLPEKVDLEAPDRLDRLQTFLMTSRADGVVLSPPVCDNAEVLSLLQATNTPYASISPARKPVQTPVIRQDDRQAAYEITQHLVEHGHRHIALIAGPKGHNASTKRYDGYRQCLEDSGIRFDDTLIVAGDYSLRSGFEGARKLIALNPRPTAIFATNDDMAVGAMTTVMASGLSIPKDISVAGFDDTRLAAAVWPALTTIRQPLEQMASAAAERLMSPDDGAAQETVFDFELIIRASTGPVPKS
ncbi:MAG: LacI family DNA-binding transcriptional regulator [Pseudomonadota bacterium]